MEVLDEQAANSTTVVDEAVSIFEKREVSRLLASLVGCCDTSCHLHLLDVFTFEKSPFCQRGSRPSCSGIERYRVKLLNLFDYLLSVLL